MNKPLVTLAAMADVLAEHPLLHHGGYGWNPRQWGWPERGGVDLKSERRALLEALDEIEAAVAYLSTLNPSQRIGSRAPSSYFLKHMAEGHSGRYVANGSLIAGALLLRYLIKVSPLSPNVSVGVRAVPPVNGRYYA